MTDEERDGFKNIPAELRERDQWLYWNASNDTPRAPLDSPAATYGCSWSDPETWMALDEVAEQAAATPDAGIGYVNAADNDDYARGLYGVIDLDGVVGDDGHPKDWVPSLQPFFDRDAYTEWSPSGEGIHIPVVGIDTPEWWTDEHFSDEEHEGVEVLTNKFSTYTGDKMRGAGDEVVEAGDWLTEWLREAYKAVTGEDPVDDRQQEIADSVADGSDTPDEEWFTPDVAEEALDHIDPDSAYSVWRDVGMALVNRFGSSGQRLFESWSRRGSKWDSDAERQAERIADDAGNYQYDAGTIIHYAQEGGWDASAAAREQLGASPPPDKPNVEKVDERDAQPGDSDAADNDGIVSVSALDRHNGGYGYFHTGEDGDSWFERVTNFEIDVNSFLFKDGERLIDAGVVPSTGEEAYDITIPAKVFNDARTFRDNVVTGLTTTFDGSPADLNELRKHVGGASAPVRTGTHHMGLHPEHGEFVTPESVLTADGWTDDPEMSYIKREIGAERAFELSPDTHDEYDSDEVAEILELLPKTRTPERFLPVLGWLYAAPVRPYIQEWTGQFNTLHVTGETGAGKSSTLSVAWQLLGMNGDPMACDDTKFALTTAMASTKSIPMWFDEYKPGDMKDWELDRFQTLMRKSTRGGVETRGNADKSTEEYALGAPLMISGEQAVQGAAEERRSIQTRFLDTVKETGSPTRQAFAELTGTAYETGSGTREPEGYDLQQHALAYYQFILERDANRLKLLWSRSREHVRDLLETHSITGIDDLPRQGLQTVHFGLILYRLFAEEVGAVDVPSPTEADDALLYIARQFGDEGNRKSHLDRFVELGSRAAAEGYLEGGKHYTVIKQGTPEEEIAIKLSRTFDAISKYARDYALDGEDMLNTANDYRERFREAAEKSGSYVTAHSKLSRPLNRCVRIDTSKAADQLAFDPTAFGAAGDDSDDEADSNGVTLGQLAPGRHTLEVTIAEQLEPKPWQQGRGHVVDDGELLTYIAEGQADPLADVSQGDRVRIGNAKIAVGRDGMKRLEVSGVCDVEVLPSVDSEQANVADAATDGGEAEAVQLKEQVVSTLEAEYGPGADVSVPGVAGAVDAAPDAVAEVLETIATGSSLLERLEGDGEYRRL
ncbi:hypothetical protein DQW50_16270 [Halorubrum sp. 48-1-W]|uniref:PriCT-2 domain-containing protein n=1 Tax=Halorubrum sp. 48-1-W TaxID=2249761 RepID=UPI000DCE75D8|nr:PriCT-2 domain-containing protein [Halorubrum sp. 48-1-W]RAW44078.1 hypothetical protein DQW50_16270 [Halorubrum sp. 48-1-W]